MKTALTKTDFNKNTAPIMGAEVMQFIKKWKGGRLKKRFNTHAQVKGYLTYSSCFVLDSLTACWLSPEMALKRNLRGNEVMLNDPRLLLIYKRSN